MNKHRLIFAGGAAFIIVATFIVFAILSKQHHPMKTVDVFNEAIENNDVDPLKKIIETDEDGAEVTDESLSAFINYLQANSNSYQVIKDSLKKQIEDEDFTVSKEQVSLLEDGKSMGIFPKYKLSARTVNLRIKGQEEDEEINLTLEGFAEKLKKSNEKKNTYGPLLPGEYKVEADIVNKLGRFSEAKKVDVWGNSDVSFFVDSESLARENRDVQKDIISAANEFNIDMSAYITSGFQIDEFMNATDNFKNNYNEFNLGFEYIKEYIEKFESKILKATVNMDELDLTQFDGEWMAEVTIFVSYDEKIKLKEEKMKDLSYEELRTFSLVYDLESGEWMVDDFTVEPFDESEIDSWENKEEINIDDSQKFEWSEDDSFI